MIQRPGNADPLTLTTAQPRATFADFGVIAIGKAIDKIVDARKLRRCPDRLVINLVVRQAKCDIAPKRVVGKKNRLRYVTDIGQEGRSPSASVFPSTRISPSLGTRSPSTMSTIVVLPAPVGPTSAID